MSSMQLPWTWSFEPPVLLLLVLAALLYWWGVQYSLTAGLVQRFPWWRRLCYAGGLVGIFLALESPIDTWSDTYLWAHMVQHLLLIVVAAPLLLFGAPLMPIWRALPLQIRRSSLRWLLGKPRPRRVALGLVRQLGAPRTIWFLFVGDFLAWHAPLLYDLTLQNQIVHDLEHLLFLGTALLFWAQVIPSTPLRPRLGYGGQAIYIVSAGFGIQVVALAFTYSTAPFYPYYAAQPRPAGAGSALVDQTSAGALMNLVGVIVFGSLFMLLLWRCFEDAWERDAGARGMTGLPANPPPPADGQLGALTSPLVVYEQPGKEHVDGH